MRWQYLEKQQAFSISVLDNINNYMLYSPVASKEVLDMNTKNALVVISLLLVTLLTLFFISVFAASPMRDPASEQKRVEKYIDEQTVWLSDNMSWEVAYTSCEVVRVLQGAVKSPENTPQNGKEIRFSRILVKCAGSNAVYAALQQNPNDKFQVGNSVVLYKMMYRANDYARTNILFAFKVE